jgi:divalent metal cation (Fe/Co/Zn/Cd) transporter
MFLHELAKFRRASLDPMSHRPLPRASFAGGNGFPDQVRMERAQKVALGSVGIGLVVLGLKFAAYWLTGSIALYSDALESIINVVAAGAAFVALRVSAQPADSNHPYGHHKAEYFSAVFEGVLVVVAACLSWLSCAQAA